MATAGSYLRRQGFHLYDVFGTYRSIRLQVLHRIAVLKKLANSTGKKHMPWSLFYRKVAGVGLNQYSHLIECFTCDKYRRDQ